MYRKIILVLFFSCCNCGEKQLNMKEENDLHLYQKTKFEQEETGPSLNTSEKKDNLDLISTFNITTYKHKYPHISNAEVLKRETALKVIKNPKEGLESLPEDIRNAEIKILVMGHTGEGKTSLIDCLSGKEFVKRDCNIECKTQLFSAHLSIDGKIAYIDTPRTKCKHGLRELLCYSTYDYEISHFHEHCFDIALHCYQDWPKQLKYNLIVLVDAGNKNPCYIENSLISLFNTTRFNDLQDKVAIVCSRYDIVNEEDREDRIAYLKKFVGENSFWEKIDRNNIFSYGFYERDEKNKISSHQSSILQLHEKLYEIAKKNKPFKIDMDDVEEKQIIIKELKEDMERDLKKMREIGETALGEDYIKKYGDHVIQEIKEGFKIFSKLRNTATVECCFIAMQKSRIEKMTTKIIDALTKLDIDKEFAEGYLTPIATDILSNKNFILNSIFTENVGDTKEFFVEDLKISSKEVNAIELNFSDFMKSDLRVVNEYQQYIDDLKEDLFWYLFNQYKHSHEKMHTLKKILKDWINENIKTYENESLKRQLESVNKDSIEKLFDEYVQYANESINIYILSELNEKLKLQIKDICLEPINSYKDVEEFINRLFRQKVIDILFNMDLDEKIVRDVLAAVKIA